MPGARTRSSASVRLLTSIALRPPVVKAGAPQDADSHFVRMQPEHVEIAGALGLGVSDREKIDLRSIRLRQTLAEPRPSEAGSGSR